MLNGLTKRDPLPPLQPRRRALMQPLQTLSASWMLCSVSGCLRRCLRGTSLADQCVAFWMGPLLTGEWVRKTKLRPLHFALFERHCLARTKPPRCFASAPGSSEWRRSVLPSRTGRCHRMVFVAITSWVTVAVLKGGFFQLCNRLQADQWALRPLCLQDLHTGEKRLPLLWPAWRHRQQEEWPPSWITF